MTGEPSGRRPRRRTLVAIVVATFVTAALGGWLAVHSSLTALRTVSVVVQRSAGVQVTEQQVLQAADLPMGRPLIDVSPVTVERAVSRLRAVAAVTVSRSWPHGLRIEVTPRVAAVVVRSGPRHCLVDHGGTAFADARGANGDLPRLSVPGACGGSGHDPGLAAAVAAVESVPAAIVGNAHDLRWSGDLLLFRTGGMTVTWGGASDAATKARELAATLDHHSRMRPGTLDLSASGVLVMDGSVSPQPSEPVHPGGNPRSP